MCRNSAFNMVMPLRNCGLLQFYCTITVPKHSCKLLNFTAVLIKYTSYRDVFGKNWRKACLQCTMNQLTNLFQSFKGFMLLQFTEYINRSRYGLNGRWLRCRLLQKLRTLTAVCFNDFRLLTHIKMLLIFYKFEN